MKSILRSLALTICLVANIQTWAQKVSVKWEFSNPENLSATTITGDANGLLTPSYLAGSGINKIVAMESGNAATGYEAPVYNPPFGMVYVNTAKTGKTGGHNIAFGVKSASGHTFKPTKISFDAAKCGTDKGNFDVYVKTSSTNEAALATVQIPLRNQTKDGNPNGYSHHEYTVNNYLVDGENFLLFLYIYNINGVDVENPKAIAFRNVVIEGVLDEPIFSANHYVSKVTFKTQTDEARDLTNSISNLKFGESVTFNELLYGDPKDFEVTAAEGFSIDANYNNKLATFNVKDDNGEIVFTFYVQFKVTYRKEKPEAKPLNRGLISVNLGQSGGSGNLISWRYREKDNNQVKFKLWRGTNATAQNSKVYSGNYIYNRTNYLDASGSTSSYYRLEVYDLNDNLLETEISGKTWGNQTMTVKTNRPANSIHNATYTPNDASFCDMDGDGEYEIILKWSPSDEKDAASTGTTSEAIFDCYKLDGTQLWRIRTGNNFFTSAHTIQFIAWDFDGDGYGEFMMKTGPGTIDGEGNYVIMGNDDPNANWLNSRGKQVEGPEYITVFDGMTGAELATIPYHTNYAAGASYWGDSKQNKSERYLAAIAWLDGPDKNPCPIFARGYYDGAFVAAYDWDGVTLKERWVSRNTSSGKGLWGEGAHWISVGDCDGDGKQEIVYGSGALDHDGSLLYRTGLGHGDALHLGDFDWNNPGLEVFMAHEKGSYGYDLRDARTGNLILRQTASSDTGRGLAANFDSSHDGAELMASCTGALMDIKGNTIADSWAIGSSGAGINNRIYWDGDPYDEFCDKSIIAHWNATGKYFDRYKFNNGNYLWGKLNNDTKLNPCVLGDMLGDWREEIVTWNEDDCSLNICATDFESHYRLPHLMDDLNYRAQVINQNCCYNQPPHLSYDPARSHQIHVTIPESGWAPVYTEYSLQLPTNATIYYVNNFDTKVDTLKMAKINTAIPARAGFLVHGAPGTEVTLKPASIAGSASANKLFGDGILPAEIESTTSTSYYKWEYREGVGLGYFLVDKATIPAGEAYLKVTAATARGHQYYLIGSTTTAINSIINDSDNGEPIFSLDGKKADKHLHKGVYISKGKKFVK